MKKFQPLRERSVENRDQPKKPESTDKLNTSRGYDMANTDRLQSLNKEKLLSTRTSTEHGVANNQPQRAASSTALIGHKLAAKKSICEEPQVEVRVNKEYLLLGFLFWNPMRTYPISRNIPTLQANQNLFQLSTKLNLKTFDLGVTVFALYI